MTNNDILRRLRYLFNLHNEQVLKVYELTNYHVSIDSIKAWLAQDDAPHFETIRDKELAAFLNGVIIAKRGRREGAAPEAESTLSNNLILRKLKIALNLQSEEILALFALVDKKISKHELSAFFRHPDNKSYRPCGNQYLRNFLFALQTKYDNTLGQGMKLK